MRTLDCLGECIYKDFDYWECTKDMYFDSRGWTPGGDIDNVRDKVRIPIGDLIIPIQHTTKGAMIDD